MSTYAVTKRWRFRHPKERHTDKKRYYNRHNKNRINSRAEWTLSEMALIVAPDRPLDRILSQKLGRSVEAVQIKRCRLKKN